ncbi:hypothetical protein JHK82_037359 [Glycine max]|uniref:Uncharacterized protein n=1 Tax=Glycine soja TaxID=3848 RepID=A0A445IAA4_GLYSO|nr:hypothetical protein JHK82_037359 [Glycine max]RZB82979.1 hypothetical protein D0Y65_031858 [Glycine soja]
MNYSSGFFIILLLLLYHFFPYSSSSMRIMIQQVTKAATENHHHMSRGAERDHVQRKALHEVHSGPNPISNSIPQQKLKNIQRNHMH